MAASAAYALIACFSLTGESLTCKPLDSTSTMAECTHSLSKAAEKVAVRGDNEDPIVTAITRYVFECVSADTVLPKPASHPPAAPPAAKPAKPSSPSKTPKPVTPKPKKKAPTPGPAMPKPTPVPEG